MKKNHFREGPIIKFNEDNYFSYNPAHTLDDSYLASKIEVFQKNKIYGDSILFENYRKGASLLDGFRKNLFNVQDVFDQVKLAKFLAISDVLGAYHGLQWKDIRFYYNPITSKLEPIGYDAKCGNLSSNIGLII